MPRDYLVVYEDEDDGTPEAADDLVLGVDIDEAPQGSYRVEADFGAAVTNQASVLAYVGLGVTLVGVVLAIVTTILFAVNYPSAWEGADPDLGLARAIAAMALVSSLMLVLGTLFVGFGRAIRARGVLHTLRFTPQR